MEKSPKIVHFEQLEAENILKNQSNKIR
ncbi:MAG: hypothetical protein ACI9LN_001175 [Saprospiraceae bacterium]|jgi:hypothetical protein